MALKSNFLPLLPPVRLDLFYKHHLIAIGIGSVVYADVGEDVGLIPVGGAIFGGNSRLFFLAANVEKTIKHFATVDAETLRKRLSKRLDRASRQCFNNPARKLADDALYVRRNVTLTSRQRQQHFTVVLATGKDKRTAVVLGVTSVTASNECLIVLVLGLVARPLVKPPLLDRVSRHWQRAQHRLFNFHSALLQVVEKLFFGDGALLQIKPVSYARPLNLFWLDALLGQTVYVCLPRCCRGFV